MRQRVRPLFIPPTPPLAVNPARSTTRYIRVDDASDSRRLNSLRKRSIGMGPFVPCLLLVVFGGEGRVCASVCLSGPRLATSALRSRPTVIAYVGGGWSARRSTGRSVERPAVNKAADTERDDHLASDANAPPTGRVRARLMDVPTDAADGGRVIGVRDGRRRRAGSGRWPSV
uniref:Uncharacterized protein n=1 Tax=Plectus sambesii TaxID=2011161 RepID=A0A914VUL6_9BILA